MNSLNSTSIAYARLPFSSRISTTSRHSCTPRIFTLLWCTWLALLASEIAKGKVGPNNPPYPSFERIGTEHGATFATALSADGFVIAGFAHVDQFGGTPQAFQWTSTEGTTLLESLSGPDNYSTANGIAADGSTIVGVSDSTNGIEAFRWASQTGMQGLGDLSGGGFGSYANDISSDGTVIVGAGSGGPPCFVGIAVQWVGGGTPSPFAMTVITGCDRGDDAASTSLARCGN